MHLYEFTPSMDFKGLFSLIKPKTYHLNQIDLVFCPVSLCLSLSSGSIEKRKRPREALITNLEELRPRNMYMNKRIIAV